MPKTSAVLTDYVSDQRKAFRRAVASMEADELGGVHAARVSCRKLRSVVQAARPIWKASHADELRSACNVFKGYASVLSAARDSEALIELVNEWAEEEGWTPEFVAPVTATIEATCNHVEPSTDTPTSADVADAIDVVLATPFGKYGKLSAREGLMMPVHTAGAKTLRRIVHAAVELEPVAHIEAIHDVRKSAKRLRYAAELASKHAPAAKRIAKAAKAVQTSIGHMQDAEEFKRRLSDMDGECHQAVLHQADLLWQSGFDPLRTQLNEVTASLTAIPR